jgi:hypothetical protein
VGRFAAELGRQPQQRHITAAIELAGPADLTMPENKTKPTTASVTEFLNGVADDTRRRDAQTLVAMMAKVTGVEPRMWGPSIVGFGVRHYRYESGREGDMPRVGFSPRKANLVLYVLTGAGSEAAWLARLGKHTTGVSCLYINKLADVDLTVLAAMIAHAWACSGGCGDR